MADFVETTEDGVAVFTIPTVAFAPSQALKDAISNGSVVASERTVEYPVKDSNGNVVKKYRQTYTKLEAKNKAGALALPSIAGDEEKLWKYVSDRADAAEYQPVYVRLRNAAQGPEAAVKKFKKLAATLSPEQLAAVREALGIAG